MRTLIHEVVADIDYAASEIVLIFHWVRWHLVRVALAQNAGAGSAAAPLPISSKLCIPIAGDDLIAGLINRHGLDTGNGNRWTHERVTSMRSNYRIPVSKPAQDRIGPRLKPRQRRTAPEDRDEDALAEDGAIESIPLRPMVLGSWPAPLTPCLPPNPSPNARLNPKYPAGSHPSQQNLLSSIT